MSDAPFHPLTPTGARYCGEGEANGHRYHTWIDLVTESNFTVPESQATGPMIQRAQRACRERFRAASAAFAPVP